MGKIGDLEFGIHKNFKKMYFPWKGWKGWKENEVNNVHIVQWTRPDQTTPSEVLLGTFWYQVHLACRTHKWTYTNSRNPRICQYLRILKERVKGLDAACEV